MARDLTIEAWLAPSAFTPNTQSTVLMFDNAASNCSYLLALDPAGRLFAGNALKMVRAPAMSALALNAWTHVAASDVTDFGLVLSGTRYLAAGNDTSLDTVEALTIEGWVNLASTNGNDPVSLSLYLLNNTPQFDVNSGSCPGVEALRVGDWTHLAGVFDAVAGTISLYVNGRLANSITGVAAPSGPPVTSGVVYRMGAPVGQSAFGGLMNDVRVWNRPLAVGEVRQYMMTKVNGGERGLVGCWPLSDRYGTTVMDLAGNSTGVVSNATFVESDKGFFCQKILLDGVETAYRHVERAMVTSEAPLAIGAHDRTDFLQATIDDMRLWKVGRLDWQIDQYRTDILPRDAEGLISEWTFETGKGRVAFDSKSENNGIITDTMTRLTEAIADTMWVPTTFRANWRLYVNGQEVAAETFSPPVPFGSSQCQIGATSLNVGVGAFYSGAMAELRTGNRALTGEQIRDTMYGPLAGNEDHLTGYWPMNDASGQIVADRTGGGGDGVWQGVDDPVWVASGAPLGIEGPQVLSVPGGMTRAGFQATINATPAVADYSDVEMDAQGGKLAAMKRAYGYVSGTALNAVTGYKIGDLVLHYVGQIQTNPTLIGYIEGAPPLPSENLTVDSPITPYKYLAASTITLTETDTATVTYTADRELGTSMTLDFKAGLGLEWDFRAGVVVQSLLVRGVYKAGYHGTDDKVLATLSNAEISTTTSATMSKSIEVFGAWQTNSYSFDPLVQRIYVPNNMGYALVKSGTADYFALRLKTTGAVVRYTAQPNPDIPEDTNIIMFKINPLYVKNGTLDGYVGFQTDKDYPFLTGGEKGSYFKALEPYALKQQIDREQQQLLSAYDRFDATELGRRFQYALLNSHSQVPSGGYDLAKADTDLTAALLQLKPGEGSGSAAWRSRLAQRNLVNTYVWNSDGGLYSEEEQYSAVHEESLGGSYSLTDTNGGYGEVSISTGPQESFDILSGTVVKTQAMKRKTEGQSFGIEVKMPGEGFLNQRAAQTTMPPGEYPVTYADNSCPGKVNQYRFMTFYLSPKKSNFETFWNKVVDPNWLNRQGNYAGTDDPDAFALRQARAYPNDVWRVLHRVTYVNRIPGAMGDAETLPPNVRRPDELSVAQNALLIADLPVPAGDPTPIGTVYSELQPLLAQLEQNPVWGTLLAAQRAETASDIMDYMRGYYEVSK